MFWQPLLLLPVPLLPRESRIPCLETKTHIPGMARDNHPAASLPSHPPASPAVQPCSIHCWQAVKSSLLPSKTSRCTSIKRKVQYLPTNLPDQDCALYTVTTCKSQGRGNAAPPKGSEALAACVGEMRSHHPSAGQGKLLNQSRRPSFPDMKSLPRVIAKATAVSQNLSLPKNLSAQKAERPAEESLMPQRPTRGSPSIQQDQDSCCRRPHQREAPEERGEHQHGAGVGRRLSISPVLQESRRRGVHKQGQETRSSWQLAFVLAIPSPLRPSSS